MDSEKFLERKLFLEVKKTGGHALKFSSGSETGYPDRLVLMPFGKVYWVELKSEGKKLRKLQQIRRTELTQLGFKVTAIDNIEKLNNFLNYIKNDNRR